jgi:hypothetical protein
MKRKCDKFVRMREALEKRRRQQARDGLPQKESPSEPDSDNEDFDIFSIDDEEAWGFRGEVPLQEAPAKGPRPQGSSVLPKERAGAWPLGPGEMTVLWEGGALPWCRGLKGPGGA